MLLSDQTIREMLDDGRISIYPPLDLVHLRPAGVRVHLGTEILVPKGGQLIDIAHDDKIEYSRCNIRDTDFVLEPGAFILAGTLESIKTDQSVVCFLDGRSTIARLGLTIHNSASILDGTFEEQITPVLEIANLGHLRIVLRYSMPIAMLCFYQLSHPCSRSTQHNQYSHQIGVTPPNLKMDASKLFPITQSAVIDEPPPVVNILCSG